jgi:hypothetical protein
LCLRQARYPIVERSERYVEMNRFDGDAEMPRRYL